MSIRKSPIFLIVMFVGSFIWAGIESSKRFPYAGTPSNIPQTIENLINIH